METDKIIQDQYESLSEPLKQALQTVPWKDIVKKISADNDLNPASVEALELETMFVLYCFEEADDFEQNVFREIGVDSLKSKMVASKVIDLIFNPILEKLGPVAETEEESVAEEINESTENKWLEVAPNNLPMVEPGEVAHDTTPEEKAFMDSPAPVVSSTPTPPVTTAEPEKPKIVSVPQYKDIDPYREPTN